MSRLHPSCYELNIAHEGIHYVRVLIPYTTRETTAKLIKEDFQRRFPKSMGYEITLEYIDCSSTTIAD